MQLQLPALPRPSLNTFGPVALLAFATAATFILSRPRRAKISPPPVLRRGRSAASGVVRWLIIGLATLGALIALGIDLHGLWSTVVAMLSLLAIGFVAMWSLLSHMLASVLIVVFRPFAIGDRIEVVGDDPVLGEVIELSLVYTTLRTDDNATLRIPNNLFFQRVLKCHAPAALANPHPPSA